MDPTNEAAFSPVRLGRATSQSSLASSSVAPTSIMGELTDESISDDDDLNGEDFIADPKKEVDRFGFTGGDQYTDASMLVLSVEKIRYREQKWLHMMNNWESWMSGKFSQVKNRCRKGIPPSLRGRAWQLLSGGKTLYEKNPGGYDKYLAMKPNTNCVEDIEKDLHRQFPFHEMFVQRGGTGQQDLRKVLRAYSVYNPEDGYCQAQAPIAAALLMHMPAEQAFWCMVAMCEHYLQGYFSPGLEAIQVDGYVMQNLLRKVSPIAYKHFENNQVTPVLYMTEWFMCVFSRTLPWTSVLRLWDMFFCEGIKVVFRCALILIRNTLGTHEKVKKYPGLYETMEALRKIDPAIMKEDRLMFEIVNLKVSERDLEHEHKLQLIRWKKDKSAGPPIKDSAKGVKRVYRYTPTFHSTSGSSSKNKLKSKQKISAISDNSAAIMIATSNAKLKLRKKGKKKKHHTRFEEGIGVTSLEKTTEKADEASNGSSQFRNNVTSENSRLEVKLSEIDLDGVRKQSDSSYLGSNKQTKMLPSNSKVRSISPSRGLLSVNITNDIKNPRKNDVDQDEINAARFINQIDETTVF